jgi:hypothetical protein
MKKFLLLCAAFLLAIGMAHISYASPLPFTDTTTFTDSGTLAPEDLVSYGGLKVNKLEGSFDHVRWTHHIEFEPPAQAVLTGTLTIWLTDDWDPWWRPFEFAFGWAEDGTFDFGEVNTDVYIYSVTASFLEDGEFTVTIADVWGDFYINTSVLSGTYLATPIPSSILLLGAGILGLIGIGFRKRAR